MLDALLRMRSNYLEYQITGCEQELAMKEKSEINAHMKMIYEKYSL